MFFKKKQHHIEKKTIQHRDDVITCPNCGGTGEILNDDHYTADCYPERRYITCNRCFGTGVLHKITKNDRQKNEKNEE